MPGANTSGGGGGSGAVRAGRAFVQLFAEDSAVFRSLDRLKARFQSFGRFTAKVGVAVGAAGLAALAPLKPALDSLNENSKLADTADAFGLSAVEASRLFGIMQAGGSDLRDATEGVVTFNQRIEDALAGTGEEAKKLFQGLGVGADAFAGGNSADRFYQLLDVLRKVPDPAKRVQLLLKAVGEDTGKNLIPLLSMSADEVRGLGDAFEQSAADLQTSRAASRSYTMAVAGIGRVWREVVTAIAPTLEQIAGAVTSAGKPVAEFIRQNRAVIVAAAAVAAGLVAGGAALIAFGAAASAVGAGIGAAVVVVKGLIAVVGALLSPVGLAVAAIAGIGYVLTTQTETGRAAFASLKAGFLSVAATAKESFGGIAAALGKGDLALAGEIAMTALELLWAAAMAKFEAAWAGFKGSFVEGWHEITGGVGELLHAMWDVVTEVYEGIWAVVKPVIDQIKAAWAGLSDSAKVAVAAIASVFAPIAGPILALAALIGDSWDGMSLNILEALNNIAAWAETTFVKVSAIIGNAFRTIVSTVLSAAIVVAENLDSLDPTDQLKGTIEQAKATRAAVDASRVDPAAEIAAIEARRKALEDELRATRAKAKAEREAGREKDVRAADAKAAELEKKLKELNAAANAPGPGQAPEVRAAAAAARGVAAAGVASGSKGSFDASRAAGQFGINDSISRKQLRVAEETARHTEETVKAVVALAKRLVFH